MAGPAYNLGGFGDQLRAEELQRALAAVGGEPLPQSQPAPPPEQAPSPDMSVQRAPGRPAKELAAYTAGDLEDQNAKIRLAQQGGQAESASALKRAGMRDEQAQAQRGYNEQARADAQETRAHKKNLQGEADKLLEEMRANLSPPSRSAGEKVWGVLGGILAMGSGGRAAQGIQLINSLVGSDRKERWAAEAQQRSALYNAVTRGIDLDNSTEEQQHEVARRMGAADALYWANAIEAEKERGMSDAMKREADTAVLELRQKARGLLRADAEKRQAAEAAAAKSRAKGQMDAKEQYFWSVPLDQLRQMPSQILGEVGQQVLGKRLDIDKKGRDPEGRGAPIAPGSSTPSGRVVENADVYNQLSQADRSKLDQADQADQELIGLVDRLIQLRQENRALVGIPLTKEHSRAKTLGMQIQLALKKADALGTLDKGSVDFLNEMTGDPNAWWVNAPEARLNVLKQTAMNNAEERAARAGLAAPNRPAKSYAAGVGGGVQRAAPAAAPEAPVTLIRPADGKAFQVHPSQVSKMRALGWTEQPVSGGSYIALPGDFYAQGGGSQQ